MIKQIIPLQVTDYQRHSIHGENRIWLETNCYVDVWVELLHAWGFEPTAALPFTFAIDFEGDQWTFFKFPLADLFDLYGLDVQELAIWRTLVSHIDEQVGRGRPVLAELDSYYLPDTAGTAYQLDHVKTTVAVNKIDLANHYMEYFHNQGYYCLSGSDFIQIFHLEGPIEPVILPPYVEFVKLRPVEKLQGESLLEQSLQLFKKHLQLIPAVNPFESFKNQFDKDLEWLMREGLDTFHQYSFATLRQYGACYELCVSYLNWLAEQGQKGLDPAITSFIDISNGAKAMQFQLARAINRQKPLELSALDAMAQRWETAMGLLTQQYL